MSPVLARFTMLVGAAVMAALASAMMWLLAPA
jgi:hypothetical protein